MPPYGFQPQAGNCSEWTTFLFQQKAASGCFQNRRKCPAFHPPCTPSLMSCHANFRVTPWLMCHTIFGHPVCCITGCSLPRDYFCMCGGGPRIQINHLLLGCSLSAFYFQNLKYLLLLTFSSKHFLFVCCSSKMYKKIKIIIKILTTNHAKQWHWFENDISEFSFFFFLFVCVFVYVCMCVSLSSRVSK